MLILPHSAGQITTRDCFDRFVANGGATARGAVKISAYLAIPIQDRHSQSP
jgi:hypothetical protein